MDSARLQIASDQVEQLMEKWVRLMKPYIPAVSRFLIVATFYEDALRILMQWSEQRAYLESFRHLPSAVVSLYLAASILCMFGCSTLVIARQHIPLSIGILFTILVSQAVLYGLVFDMLLFLRHISMTGGLLLCLSESMLHKQVNKKSMFVLPQLFESERHQYFQFAGRVLIVVLFVVFIFNGEWGLVRSVFSLIGFVACTMVVVGFRARWSAMLLVSLLCVINMLMNSWWSVEHSGFERDFAKYDFFQTLSVAGGLLLLVSIGPGGLS